MLNPSSFLLRTLLLSIFVFLAAALPAEALDFVNPVVRTANAGCRADNLRGEHFAAEMNADERLKVCRALDKITDKLNSTAWSPALTAELKGIWTIFSDEPVALRLMPKGASSRILAMAEAFPAGARGNTFEACVYLRPEKSGDGSFFQVMLHELRHIYDFYNTWKDKSAMDSLEVERRAFLLMSALSQETHKNASGVPKFWKESWRKLPANESAFKSAAAVDKYLQNNKFYRQLAQNPASRTLDFSYRNAVAENKGWQFISDSPTDRKAGERLPQRPALPATAAVLPQNIQQLNFDLEKPGNPRDEKEVLRVALRNEKKLYYGMSNYVYDQKLQFQCWQKDKVSDSFSENNTVTRTDQGNAVFQLISAPAAPNSQCTRDSRNFKMDFEDTFWASPALEKMPISFVGFVEVEGKTLARYTVLQPSASLFTELARQYQSAKPFRVFVGTIFVSPEDGQIVRFWGTSFPETAATGNAGASSKKVWGSYSVTALRQKLNIKGGLWVTVYVGTVAVAEVQGNPRPFSYTVKFENYRQSTTDVRIIDEDVAKNSSFKSSPVSTR